MRIAIYRRVSTQEQAASRNGLDSQADLCRAAIARESGECEIIDFCDEGVSGSIPLSERKAGRMLCDAIAAETIDVVVALAQDRLFRDVLDSLATLARWDELGVRVLLVDGGWIDMDDDDKWLSFMVKALFAEKERRDVRKRTRRALQAARDRGRDIGGVPFGFRTTARMVDGKRHDGGVWEQVPEQQAVIERIRLLRSGDRPMAYNKIARLLRDENVPTMRGFAWKSESVRRVAMRSRV